MKSYQISLFVFLTTVLWATASSAKTTPCTITFAGQQVVCSPAAFTDAEAIWVPLDDLARVTGKELRAAGDTYVVDSSKTKIPRRIVHGNIFISLKEFADSINASVIKTGQSINLMARITDVRFSGGQLKITTSLPVRYTVRRLSAPERIYIDFANTRLETPASETRSSSSIVRALRVGQAVPATARVTAETTGRLDYTIKSAPLANLIVLNVSPLKQTDPPSAALQAKKVTKSAGAATISSIRLDTSADRKIRFVILSENALYPEITERPSEGALWLAFNNTTVTSSEREWTTGGDLIKIAKLEVDGSASAGARLVVRSARVLVSRLLAGQSENELVWELSLPQNADETYQGKTIIIDPGHGGQDGGAQGNSLQEKNINLAIALAAADEAKARGLNPVLTRDGDYFQTLKYRTDQIQPNNASIFVSIHSNSNGKANSTTGTEVYFHKSDPDSRTLAQIVVENICGRTRMTNRGARSDSKLYKTGLAVLRNSNVPAILVEVGYVNHSSDAARLKDTAFQTQVAKAIIDGVTTYLGEPFDQDQTALTPTMGIANRHKFAGRISL